MERSARNLLLIVSGLLMAVLAAIPIATLIVNFRELLHPASLDNVVIYLISAVLVPLPLYWAAEEIFNFAKADPYIDMSDRESRKIVGNLLTSVGEIFIKEAGIWFLVFFSIQVILKDSMLLVLIIIFGGSLGFLLMGKLLGRIGNYMKLSDSAMKKLREERENKGRKGNKGGKKSNRGADGGSGARSKGGPDVGNGARGKGGPDVGGKRGAGKKEAKK